MRTPLSLKFSLALILLLVLAFRFYVTLASAESSEDVAASAVTNSEEVVVSAYQTVLEAEKAGANVSDLLIKLNEAESFLADARMAYSSTHFDEAVRLASIGQNIAAKVQTAAVKLRDSTVSENSRHIIFTMIASVMSVAFVALGSFWTWHFLKNRCSNRAGRFHRTK